MNLRDKKVIITGGVRGLGRAMVAQIISKGAAVAVFDLDATGLGQLQNELAVQCFHCDVSDYDQVIAATGKYHEQSGAADVLIDNAGILYSAPLLRLTSDGIEKHAVDLWRKVIAADLDSVFFMTACVAEKMMASRTKGVIVNVSSVSASGNAGQTAYSAAKAGVNALTAVWAKELGPLGIRVVAVAPGFTNTESTKEALSEAVLNETIKKVPLRRLGQPEEIGAAVVAVIENDFFNGKVFEVDGGLTI